MGVRLNEERLELWNKPCGAKLACTEDVLLGFRAMMTKAEHTLQAEHLPLDEFYLNFICPDLRFKI